MHLFEQGIFGHLHSFDIDSFISLWDFLSKRFFFHLDAEHLQYSSLLKSDLLKYFLVNTVKSNRKDKLLEFFASFSHEILAESGDSVAGNLRSWFVLPYMEEPEKDPEFSQYFSNRWAESLRSTIGSFLSTVLQTAPPPKLLLLERWFHSDAQQEMRAQLSLSSKKVDCLVSKLEKSEERLAHLRSAVRELAQCLLKFSVANAAGSGLSTGKLKGSSGHSGLFESDEEADAKKVKVS